MLYSNLRFILVSIFMGLIVVSCDSGGGNDSEHTEAEGFVFENEAGDAVYTYLQGTVTGEISLHVGDEIIYSVHFLDANGDDVEHVEGDDHEDLLAFTGYDEGIISIMQIDEHCDEITDQTECDESDHCEWHADDMECEEEEHCDDLDEVACEESDHCEWHADDDACEEHGHRDDDDHDHDDHDDHDDHEMLIKITGVGVGSTSFKLLLMHGDHADFQTADNTPVQVTVESE